MNLFGKSEDSNKFFNQLNQLAKNTLDSLIELEKFFSLKDELELKDYAIKKQEMKEILKQIQETHDVIIDDIQNSFVTPIDREDIFNISHSFSELARYTYSTIDEIATFNIQITTNMQQMIKNIRKQTEELYTATQRLDKNPRVATNHLGQVKKYEELVERTYRKAIFSLFESTNASNLSDTLLKREVYRHISNMSDKAVSSAKVLGMIVMKLS
jgi:uncharacterized protein Yka (UPF0111/DUF47 family)